MYRHVGRSANCMADSLGKQRVNREVPSVAHISYVILLFCKWYNALIVSTFFAVPSCVLVLVYFFPSLIYMSVTIKEN